MLIDFKEVCYDFCVCIYELFFGFFDWIIIINVNVCFVYVIFEVIGFKVEILMFNFKFIWDDMINVEVDNILFFDVFNSVGLMGKFVDVFY